MQLPPAHSVVSFILLAIVGNASQFYLAEFCNNNLACTCFGIFCFFFIHKIVGVLLYSTV